MMVRPHLNTILVVVLISSRKALYAEMREGLLSDEAEYASKPLRDHLKRR